MCANHMEISAIGLIGPSGSGKSSIGRSLAARLRWSFVDSDRDIEQQLGQTIAEIFQLQGEKAFRDKEREFLQQLAGQRPTRLVIATGGGMPIFSDNWQLLENMAVLVYLYAPVEVLVTRINKGEERPLLAVSHGTSKSGSSKDLAKRLGNLIAERHSIYNRARYKIDTSAADVEQLADDIIRLLGLVI